MLLAKMTQSVKIVDESSAMPMQYSVAIFAELSGINES
jgi:hypothetical protein